MSDDQLVLPATLCEWRDCKDSGSLWASLAPFFEEHGYRLFVPLGDEYVAPPGCNRHRAPDEWHHWPPLELFGGRVPHSKFRAVHPINFAARSALGTDVVIRIIQRGGEGAEFLDILRFLSSPAARVNANRTVPMIAEVQKDDMVFGVFPFMSPSGLTRRWFETTRELLDGLEQVFETFNFLHENLIAHRDFSFAEVFLNFGSAHAYVPEKSIFPPRRPGSFRKFFDAQYFINDFELSVQYSSSSDPASRRVISHPSARYGDDIEIYGKALPPEARLDEPYCPFKADIFQLGQSILNNFGYVTTLPGLVPLAERMASTDPSLRPSIAEALVTLRVIRMTTPDTLLDEIPRDAHGVYGWDEQTDGIDSAGPTTPEATFSADTAMVVGLVPEELPPDVKKFELGTDPPLPVASAHPRT